MIQQNNQIQIKADDVTMKGVYSNATKISHTKEEFVLDFMNIIPPSGTLNARVIVSPGHFKQLVMALQDNLKKYETQFGDLQPAETPKHQPIGFASKD